MKQRIFLGSALFVIFALSIFIQTTLLFNCDISWLMLAAKRMLAGGTYTKDFFEPNPPMAIYIYIPAVLLAKATNLSSHWSLFLYVYLMSFISLFLCHKLLKTIFLKEDSRFIPVLMMTIASVLLILPAGSLGQKENFLIILSLPYLLLVSSRLEKHEPSHSFSILIGLLAGIGFAIKPFFLIAFMLIEIYFCFQKRTIKALLRPEILTIGTVLIIYVSLILFLHMDYLSIVIPNVAPSYYLKFNISIWETLSNNQTINSIFVLLFFIVCYKNNHYKQLCSVLLLASIGFFISFIIQRQTWFYRLIPLLSTDIILSVLLFQQLLLKKLFDKWTYVTLCLFTVFFLVCLSFQPNYMGLSVVFYPYAYFIFFGILLFCLLLASDLDNRLIKAFISTLICLMIASLFYKLGQHPAWSPHLFFLTTLSLLLAFVFFIPQKSFKIKLHYTFLAFIGITYFSYLFFKPAFIYNYNANLKASYNNYNQLMKHYSNQSIYFFTRFSQVAFPVIDNNNITFASRFHTTNFQPYLYYNDSKSHYLDAYHLHQNELNFFLKKVVEDINRYKPDFIFVDVRTTNHNILDTEFLTYSSEQPDYIRLFSIDPIFNKMFKSYDYVKTVEENEIYKFKIYRRHTLAKKEN